MEKPNLSLVAAAGSSGEADATGPAPEPTQEAPADSGPPASEAASKPRPNPFTLARAKNWIELGREFGLDLTNLLAKYPDIASEYTLLTIFDKHTSIGPVELDRIYSGLKVRNPQ